jgi:hypothetical protein
MTTITEQIQNAFFDGLNWSLWEDTRIAGKLFLEDTCISEILEEFGYKDRSFDFLVGKSTDGALDLFDIHECHNDSFFVIYEDTQNVIWHLGSIYWDFEDYYGELVIKFKNS